MLVDILAQARDLEGLQKYAPMAKQLAERLGHTLYEGIAHRALAVMHKLLGNSEKAVKELQQAMALFKELNVRWQIGRTHLELGELAVDGGNIEFASAHFSEALKAFEEVHAMPAMEQAQNRLKSLL